MKLTEKIIAGPEIEPLHFWHLGEGGEHLFGCGNHPILLGCKALDQEQGTIFCILNVMAAPLETRCQDYCCNRYKGNQEEKQQLTLNRPGGCLTWTVHDTALLSRCG